jgi:hypothetical protein
MTTREVAIRDHADLMVARTDSWTAVVEDVAVLAQRIAGTELVPSALRGKAPAVAASILYGREIGLPPMTALRSVYVVNGQVALKAEAMRGLILAAGHELVFTESTAARCVVRARRKTQEDWSEVTWTIDDARRAGLVKPGSAWNGYPRAMLKARATGEIARDLFADVIAGFVALEEVDGAEPDVPQHDGTEPRAPKAVTRKRTTPKGGVPGFPSTYPKSQPIPGDRELPYEAPASPPGDGPSPGGEAGIVPLPGEPGYGDDMVPTDMPPPPTSDAASPPPTSDEDPPGGGPREDEPRDTSAFRTYPAQRTKLHAILTELGVRDRDVRLRLAGMVIGRTLESSNDLTRGEASVLIDTLEKVNASQTMREALTAVLASADPVAQLDAIADRIGALAAIADGDVPPEPPDDDPWHTDT